MRTLALSILVLEVQAPRLTVCWDALNDWVELCRVIRGHALACHLEQEDSESEAWDRCWQGFCQRPSHTKGQVLSCKCHEHSSGQTGDFA